MCSFIVLICLLFLVNNYCSAGDGNHEHGTALSHCFVAIGNTHNGIGSEFGCDTFDCVGPTRMARNGSLYTKDGRINIKKAKYTRDFTPLMSDCDCECCRHYTRAYLHHLFKTDEITAKVLASIHNEHFIVHTVDCIRASLKDGFFQDYKKAFLSRYYANK